jgi:N-formylglutamate amidohydrolase
MERPGPARRDSLHHGGQVPDSGGVPAWSLHRPEPSPIPVLIAAPHGGRCYPDSLCAAMHNPGPATQRLEDRYVDRLAEAVAGQTGAALLVAHAPRAMIDLNRGMDDMDWEMLRHDARGEGGQRQDPSRRARSGLGLVPRRLPGIGELWKEKIGLDELEARIAGVHRPYHEALGGTLGRIRQRWGAALLLDLHSMPPLGRQSVGRMSPHFVIGDRFGASCDGAIASAAFDWFAKGQQQVAHNRPYAGGYALDRHGAPGAGIHALQLEVCRTRYLDARLAEPTGGLIQTAQIIAGLVRALAVEVAALGRGAGQPLAAE